MAISIAGFKSSSPNGDFWPAEDTPTDVILSIGEIATEIHETINSLTDSLHKSLIN